MTGTTISRSWRVAALLAVPAVLATGCSATSPEVSGPATVGPSATSPRGSARPAATTTSTRTSNKPSATTTSKTSLSDADPADAPDACDLITEQDAVAAFGETAIAGDQGRDECWWSTANDLKTVNIIRRTGDIDEWRQGLQNSSWEKVDRGDEGYAGKVLDSITFRLGETTYEINVVYSTSGDPEQVVNDLADTVLGRL